MFARSVSQITDIEKEQGEQHPVVARLKEFCRLWCERDLETILSFLSASRKTVMYGTGKDEKLIGREAIRQQCLRDWAQSDSASIEFKWMTSEGTDTLAWTASDILMKASVKGQPIQFEGRLTTLWENERGSWQLVQWHISLPAAEQEQGQSFPRFLPRS
jgi:hypothetical protein